MHVGAVQMTSGEDVAANLEQARRLLRTGEAADLLVLPENFALMAANNTQRLELAARAAEIGGQHAAVF